MNGWQAQAPAPAMLHELNATRPHLVKMEGAQGCGPAAFLPLRAAALGATVAFYGQLRDLTLRPASARRRAATRRDCRFNALRISVSGPSAVRTTGTCSGVSSSIWTP